LSLVVSEGDFLELSINYGSRSEMRGRACFRVCQ
jgi:hypothetical protein